MHTYTHPFIPRHTYNNAQQIKLLLNMVLLICNFLLKTPPTEMALVPSFVNQFPIFFKILNPQTHLSVEHTKLVPYFCVLLSNLPLKSSNFCRESRRRKKVIFKSKLCVMKVIEMKTLFAKIVFPSE